MKPKEKHQEQCSEGVESRKLKHMHDSPGAMNTLSESTADIFDFFKKNYELTNSAEQTQRPIQEQVSIQDADTIIEDITKNGVKAKLLNILLESPGTASEAKNHIKFPLALLLQVPSEFDKLMDELKSNDDLKGIAAFTLRPSMEWKPDLFADATMRLEKLNQGRARKFVLAIHIARKALNAALLPSYEEALSIDAYDKVVAARIEIELSTVHELHPLAALLRMSRIIGDLSSIEALRPQDKAILAVQAATCLARYCNRVENDILEAIKALLEKCKRVYPQARAIVDFELSRAKLRNRFLKHPGVQVNLINEFERKEKHAGSLPLLFFEEIMEKIEDEQTKLLGLISMDVRNIIIKHHSYGGKLGEEQARDLLHSLCNADWEMLYLPSNCVYGGPLERRFILQDLLPIVTDLTSVLGSETVGKHLPPVVSSALIAYQNHPLPRSAVPVSYNNINYKPSTREIPTFSISDTIPIKLNYKPICLNMLEDDDI